MTEHQSWAQLSGELQRTFEIHAIAKSVLRLENQPTLAVLYTWSTVDDLRILGRAILGGWNRCTSERNGRDWRLGASCLPFVLSGFSFGESSSNEEIIEAVLLLEYELFARCGSAEGRVRLTRRGERCRPARFHDEQYGAPSESKALVESAR